MVLTWHDVDYEYFFFLTSSNLHEFQQIKMKNKILVE
jgi:hypothetical protein